MNDTKFKELKIWIPWMKGTDPNNPGKKPSLNGRRYAKWSDRSILMRFNEAMDLKGKTPGLNGIGFVVPDGYVIIDLDNCIENNIINNQSLILIKKFDSYTEKSPSGKGLHIIAKSNLKCKKWTEAKDGQSVEYITPGNFVTFTGDYIKNSDIKEIVIEEPHKVLFVQSSKQNMPNGGGGGCIIKYPIRYGKAALTGECKNIRGASIGSRTNTLLRAAFNIGRLIPGGFVNEAEAVYSLEAAAKSTGLPKQKIRRTIADGIRDGKKNPRTELEIERKIQEQ